MKERIKYNITSELREPITERMARIRTQKEMSLKECAKQLGIPKSTYEHYERGDSKLPAYVVKEFCRKFNVSYEYLFDGEETSNFEPQEETIKPTFPQRRGLKELIEQAEKIIEQAKEILSM